MNDKLKEIPIKTLIEQESGSKFNQRNKLDKCPFCGSGSGPDKSPAFSIHIKGNYYKCFSCGSGGSAIDFLMNFHKGWKERHAMKHLEENYLHIKTEMKALPELNPFQKTIYAIKNNPIEKATQYLIQRNIDTKQLPSDSYSYDTLSNAIVFIDARQELINRRMIQPVNGSPKAKNQGKLIDSIYDKLFKPELDTIFIHEGVINALSMPKYSSIAIFSTENKLKNPKKLQPYVNGKHVVLAFDNDKAGNNCYKYYKNFLLSNRFDILSLRKLVFPENKDANDLLCDGSLDKFLRDKTNYQLEWEDILTKPIESGSKSKNKCNNEYFFYIEKGCYYTKETIKGKPSIKKLSDFLMEFLYHLKDGTTDTKRIVKYQRSSGEIAVCEIHSSELNMERFKKVIRSISDRGLSFFGTSLHMDFIFKYNFDREKLATPITQLGYQSKFKVYCFADALITIDNHIIFPDKLGIASDGKNTFYLAPFAHTNINNQEYQGLRKFTYKEGELDFKHWAELIYKAYGINGAIGVSFIILALFRDYILKLVGFFPFLFLFGDQGVGKSNFINFFLCLFGEPNNGISLLNSTEKGFSRALSQRNNALIYLKEYTNVLDKKAINVFKTAYDNELYTMAQKSNDNKTTTLVISSACMVDGNELPTSEAALFARMIVLNFEDNKFSKEATEAYKTLVEQKDNGFCQVTRELLKYRSLVESKFKSMFDDVFYKLKSELTSEMEISDRQIRHISLLLTPVKLLKDRLDFPFDYNEYSEAAIDNARNQDALANEIKDVTIFWNAFAFKINDPIANIREGVQYLKDPAKKILFIKYKLLYPLYAEYTRKNNMQPLETTSLRELLTSNGNKSFISNSTQKSRKMKSYTHKTLGSCYMFKYETPEEGEGIIVNDVEINI